MNRGDSQRIARAMNKAVLTDRYHRQSAASLWAFYIEALADVLEACGPNFNREEFLATCRGGGAPSVGQDQEIEA